LDRKKSWRLEFLRDRILADRFHCMLHRSGKLALIFRQNTRKDAHFHVFSPENTRRLWCFNFGKFSKPSRAGEVRADGFGKQGARAQCTASTAGAKFAHAAGL
jgi:hypothetical protein